jgi:hypothetical protein
MRVPFFVPSVPRRLLRFFHGVFIRSLGGGGDTARGCSTLKQTYIKQSGILLNTACMSVKQLTVSRKKIHRFRNTSVCNHLNRRLIHFPKIKTFFPLNTLNLHFYLISKTKFPANKKFSQRNKSSSQSCDLSLLLLLLLLLLLVVVVVVVPHYYNYYVNLQFLERKMINRL